MTAIAGAWGPASCSADALLDAMGRRAAAHRDRFLPAPDLAIASGHHDLRPGEGVAVEDGFALVIDARLETEAGDSLPNPGQAVIGLYRSEGLAGFARLIGEFALVLWDPERRLLVCARDALGSRPLFYRKADATFAFASEERGLSPLFGDEGIDDLRIAEFFAGEAPPADRGQRPSVFRVLPGTAVVASETGVGVERFDSLSLPPETNDLGPLQAERFRYFLQDSVRRRSRMEPAVDCFLSGGLDSSSIVRLAAKEASGRIRTLSLIHAARPELSERIFIDEVLSGQDFDAVFHDVADYDPYQGAEGMLERHSGPVAAPNLLMMRPLYETARPGAVLFDGHGGDEVVSKGGGRLLELARNGAWIRLYCELRGVADLYGESPAAMFFGLYRSFGPGRYKLRALLGRLPRKAKASVKPDPLDLLAPDFRKRSEIDGALARRWRPKPLTGREADHNVLTGPQQSHALEILDREAQDAGVEIRIPFWDRALIDYSLSLPSSAKLQGGWTRRILRLAMADDLPPRILWRRDKHDFSRQLLEGLRRSPVVSHQALEAARPGLAPYLDVDHVLALRDRLDEADAEVPGHLLQALWRIGLWSLWLAPRTPPATERPVP